MKYLFFDIECANCFKSLGKICEFGYVLTDEKFNIIEKEEYIINPKAPFDWYVLKNMLAFKKEDYLNAPIYTEFFPKIKSLFDIEDVKVFGHTTNADIGYLNDESKRYSLPYINCKFYDVKVMYSIKAEEEPRSLEHIANELGIDFSQDKHVALDDAFATMQIAKEMCNKYNATMEQLIKDVANCQDETLNGLIDSSKDWDFESLTNKGKEKKLKVFIKEVKPNSDIVESILNGKEISLTMEYEEKNFKEMLSLVQLLANHNCKYVFKASSADYFVEKKILDKDGNEKICRRLEAVKTAIKYGAKVKVISFEELLNILHIEEKTLSEMPYPDKSIFGKRIRDRQHKVNSVKTSIGELIK